jgi:hypothetical protein
LTRGICNQLDESCCSPCSDEASKYLDCLVTTQLGAICPDASCNAVVEDGSSSTVTESNYTTTNTTTPMTETNEIPELIERAAPQSIDVDGSTSDNKENLGSDYSFYTGGEKPVAASEKVPVNTNEATPDAEVIGITSSAYRRFNQQSHVSSVAMSGILLMAMEFVRTM